ncbi:hypothetical protein LTR20_004280 [Exophiala xenobiotica]|nr:hypothetical protein LTR40_007752 [Exophiala xenobiotica]KAK5360190.1 hypothetical protein LTS13_010280 [Exophiala xenobiotica]KAK5398836.1 hypothetical protein LTR79_003834 [Exophiala xenobiotica]KAK5421488.1 hypothetical protein LTR90_002978 [Exophiala xenobiotica]KAK5465862.1 hypothetical protein LTR20_004280 [Exophiala xenobiotica]
MADLDIKIGHTIVTQDGREGAVRYIGPLHIAAGEWLGLELPDDSGKNDGSVKGQRYFECPAGYGIFVRKESAVRIAKQASQNSQANGTSSSAGPSTRPRPSSGVTADVARKRQSLMGPGAGSVHGSRASLRSPTKSPTKPRPSIASSTGSTPRTGTPATTVRTSDSSTRSRLSTAGRLSMAPPSTTSRSSATANRQSFVGGAVKPVSARPSSIQTRQSLAGSRLSMSSKPLVKSERVISPPASVDEVSSLPLEEEDEEEEEPIAPVSTDADNTGLREPGESQNTAHELVSSRQPSVSSPRDGLSAPPEDRSRQAQVIKALETKVRSLQKQRQDEHSQLQNVQDLRNQNSRYEGIIQALQKKLKTNQQEMTDLKVRYDEAESRARKVPDQSAEHESELELATLDKEMAEERADMFETELEALKLKHEELELEAEILREENRELTSVMSPEEKASAGWLQMERETERLRQALVMLRDMSQQNEADLKNEIKELHETLDELEQSATKYEEAAAKLSKSEETVQHLREQLEAAEANDDILEAMGAERDQNRHELELLKRQIQDFEEHIQIADELEAFHVDEEKRLHYQLDESEAMINEKQRQNLEQQKAIEDMEYTLTKFREVVQGLQSDIDELRRSRDISETEANEMSSKSRAMMDLNLRLQSSAAKTQLKAIDLELGKMKAEQASLHLEIVLSFVPETFDLDKKPISAILCLKRIRSKAQLSRSVLADRIRDRPDLIQDSSMSTYAVMEKMSLIANMCDRFVQFMSTCSLDEFMKYAGAPFELEPVELAVSAWVEALRHDELAPDGPDHLQRMAGILTDMAEKLLSDNLEAKTMELLANVSMTETYTDSIASQAQILDKMVQGRLGAATVDDEDAMTFRKRLDQVGVKSRTVKYISGKLLHALNDLRARSMCLNESMWHSFAEAENIASALSQLTQRVGHAAMEELNKIDRDEPLSYSALIDKMTLAAGQQEQQITSQTGPEDVFDILTKQLSILQAMIDDLHTKSADLSGAVEFEKGPAPWIVRAKEVKTQKLLSQDMQEEMARLKLRIQEQTIRISERDRQIEEQQVKVELLESRAKDTKLKDDGVKSMQEEIDKLRAKSAAASEHLQRLEADHRTLLETRENQRMELDAMKQRVPADGQGLPNGPVDETTSLRFKAEIELLKVEIASLEASVRFLKSENMQLRVPVDKVGEDSIEHAWLDPSLLKMGHKEDKARGLRAESKEVFADLIELAKTSKPVKLAPKSAQVPGNPGSMSTWRARSTTTSYQILQRKEELERWNEMKDDLVRRARIVVRPSPPRYTGPAKPRTMKVNGMTLEPSRDVVRIVQH